MAQCAHCGSHIQDDESSIHYFVKDLSPELITILEQQKGTTFTDLNEEICQTCFSNATETLCKLLSHKEKKKVGRGRPKRWSAETEKVQQQNVEHKTSSSIECVWCKTSINSKRTHAIPDGPVRQLLSQIIHPRKIPQCGLVCHKCWVYVSSKLTEKAEKKCPDGARRPCSVNVCSGCSRSLSLQRKQILYEGPIRDEIAARIFPKELPVGTLVCYACWLRGRRAVDRRRREEEASQEEPVIEPIKEQNEEKTVNEYISLSKYHRLQYDYSSCVAGCAHNAVRAPLAVRCRLLANQNLYLPGLVRLCKTHCDPDGDAVLNFQGKNLSNTFTGDQIADMLFLMKRHKPLDVDNVEAMDQHVRRIWFGVTWEQFLALTRVNPSIPSRAVAIRLCQMTSNECPEVLASLFQLPRQEIDDALRLTKHLNHNKPEKLDHTRRLDHNKKLDKSDPVIPSKKADAEANTTTTKVPLNDFRPSKTLTPASAPAAIDVELFLDQMAFE